LRQWLIENGFQGLEGQKVPAFSDEWIMEVSERYVELFQKITGRPFELPEQGNIQDRIYANVLTCITPLMAGI
jgi:phosphoribosylaminoimidazole-succinocarboxamide synthase